MEIDPRFASARQSAVRRRWRKRLKLGGGITAALTVAGLLSWLFLRPGPSETEIALRDEAQTLVQSEATSLHALVAAAAPFVDLPGDPMILRFEASSSPSKRVPGPPTLDPARIGPVTPTRLQVIEDRLIPRETRLMTVLPSSREDFAFFQAQQSQFLTSGEDASAQQTDPTQVSDAALAEIWGEALESGGDGARFTRTAIQNTTTLTLVKPQRDRRKIYDEVVLVVEADQPLAALAADQGISQAAADRFSAAVARLLPGAEALQTSQLVALRVSEGAGGREPLQFSLYGSDGYVGSVARIGPGRYAMAADPWVDTDLMALSANAERVIAPSQNYRLLDAVYSAAIRGGMETALVGELIVMLSQVHDLDGFASAQDQMTLIHAPGAASGPGGILYLGITGPARNLECFVVPQPETGGYGCYAPGLRGGFGSAMTLPVRGWPMSSPFGPRHHPILKTVRDHNGVDWAAPIGTPVVAAFAGVVRLQISEGYGNLVIVDHGDGVETRYAHLNSFAVEDGAQVAPGQKLGEVGSTGMSTGPHLHFEVRVAGVAVDPVGYSRGGLTASAAVEALTDRIIRVESGGDASAKNPLSSATGLGQFIDGTWLRLMRSYRPDLFSEMSREDILALRTNPAISREMVQRLARENEAYLRDRGHTVTAGRLYLAHFLGAEGADTALRATDDQSVADVMGAAVVRANPFLKDYSIATLKAWADGKMSGPVTRSAPPPPAEVQTYMALIRQVFAEVREP